MLILTRKKGETFTMTVFGPNKEEIIINLVDIENRSAKIGITASPNVKILRDNVKPKRNRNSK